jgi:hypothetical protein
MLDFGDYLQFENIRQAQITRQLADLFDVSKH